MKFVWREEGEPDDAGRFDDRGVCPPVPPPARLQRTMGGVNCREALFFAFDQAAQHRAKSVAAVAHWEQDQVVVRPRLAPTPGDQFGCRLRGERSFEFVGHDQNVQRHGGFNNRRSGVGNRKLLRLEQDAA